MKSRILPLILLVSLGLTSCGSEGLSHAWESPEFTVHPYTYHTETDIYPSSTRLGLSWSHPDFKVNHFELVVDDDRYKTSSDSYTLGELMAGTNYEITLSACLNKSCSEKVEGEMISASTAEEIWMLESEGAGYENATEIVKDGNTLAYFVDHEDGGAEYPSALRLYGSTRPDSELGLGLSVAFMQDEDDLSSFEFSKRIFQSCDINHEECLEGAFSIYASQTIPLKEEESTLTCFEGYFIEDQVGPKNTTTEIYCLNSQDAWASLDYDSSEDEVCGNESNEYREGGTCELEKVIGLEDGFMQARQFKIGFPKRESWAWDTDDESFIVVTGEDNCGQTQNGLFYGEWLGGEWEMAKDQMGCLAPLAESAHGPVIVHLGGSKYKLYYEYRMQDGAEEKKPFHMFYINLDNPNFESQADARDVHFVWSDGSSLTDAEEAGLGDHMIHVLNHDLDHQVMAVNLNGRDNTDNPGPSQGLGLATLLNP